MTSSEGRSEVMGACGGMSLSMSRPQFSAHPDGKFTRDSTKFGIPLYNVHEQRRQWKEKGALTLGLCITPDVFIGNDYELKGDIEFRIDRRSFSRDDTSLLLHSETVCRPVPRDPGLPPNTSLDSFVVQVRVVGRIVDSSHPCLDIFLEPRALIENRFPIPITLRTPMPHTYSDRQLDDEQGSTIHELKPNKKVEIYTLGPSIAISVKCTDNPVGGTPTGWIDGNWVDLPLTPGYRLPEPLRCSFPFTSYSGGTVPGGPDFFIADGAVVLSDLSSWAETNKEEGSNVASGLELAFETPTDGGLRTFYITICNFSVDHTGESLFGIIDRTSPRKSVRKDQKTTSTPLGAYRSNRHHGRISLLPPANEKIQLIHLTMEGETGMRRSQPFRMEEISIAEGGVNSSPILWENGQPSGLFGYQKLINGYQSELHVIPEFIVFNGSKKYTIRVRQMKGVDAQIQPGKIAPLRTSEQQTPTISIEWSNPDFDGGTSPLQVDKLGLRVAIVRTRDGIAIGSVAIQTVVGSVDSRLVVKLAEIRLGSEARHAISHTKASDSILENDFLRVRIQWSELKVTLNEGRPVVGMKRAYLETALDQLATDQGGDPDSRFQTGGSSEKGKTWVEARNDRTEGVAKQARGRDAVCCLLLRQFTVDWQRVFKEDPKPGSNRTERQKLQSLERSQLSVIIHNIRITDETPQSRSPIVLDSTSGSSFFDLCVRVKGPFDSELVKVDLFDLNLAHSKGKSDKIVISTSEDFAWKLLDLGDRILAAAGEFSGVELELEWDEAHGGFKVQIRDAKAFTEDGPRYTPPNSEQLYDIALARVSPFALVASFERTPIKSRYGATKRGKAGAALMNYFTQRLKSKIDKAELEFAQYQATQIRGPRDRIIEMISTVYISRMKLKLVTLMSAVSVQDWKFLAARADGNDEFVDGDLVRAAGNLAGNTANYIFKHSGRGIESVLKKASSNVGSGIERASLKVGAGALGSGVNSVVSGVGGGLGEAVGGVGAGAGKVVKGVGKGVGQVFGGGKFCWSISSLSNA
jgi:hypothetical protein